MEASKWPTTTYVVQMKEVRADGDDAETVWLDVATVDLPQKSKRSGAVTAAIDQAALTIDLAGSHFRVLTAECAEEIPVRLEPNPQLVIG